MESLRIKKETYKIEVNDNGDYIEFNLRDINLPDKILNSAEKINKERQNLEIKMKACEKQYGNNPKLLTKKIGEIQREYFKNMRYYFDGFLGENACYKIFGKDNFYGMFEELMEQLEKHFDKMELQIEEIKKDLVEKYSPKSKEVI